MSGVVETIGKGVEKFRVGDEVLAATGFGGGYAEYICLPDTDVVGRIVIEVAKKPANLTFEEAAAVPIGGMTALAFLRKQRQERKEGPCLWSFGKRWHLRRSAC